MNNTEKVTHAIVEQGMLPLYFNADETVSLDILKTIYKAGVKAIEYTSRGEAAYNNFKKMVFYLLNSNKLYFRFNFSQSRCSMFCFFLL